MRITSLPIFPILLIMKNLLTLFVFSLLLTAWACQSNPAANKDNTAATADTDMDKPADDAKADMDDENAAYQVKVLKSDIPSPRKEMSGKVGNAMVTVNYGSPSVKGRNLWGDLVPYGQVWRTGANEATTITVNQDIKIGGETLPAGTYGMFTIPGENEWTIVFNEVAEQWGAYDYDASKDVLRVKATPKMVNESSETMDFMIDGDQLVLRWGKLMLPIEIDA